MNGQKGFVFYKFAVQLICGIAFGKKFLFCIQAGHASWKISYSITHGKLRLRWNTNKSKKQNT